MREEHHIIPEAYGGTDGPLVSLCDTHHTTIHKMATALKKGKNPSHLLGTTNPEQVRKLMWLATRIQEAEERTRNDPNKRTTVVVNLDPEVRAALEALASVYPTQRGRPALIRTAILFLYRHHFQSLSNR